MRRDKDLQVQKATGYRDYEKENTMVGERYRREMEDEAQKWKRRTKVWNILKKGEITSYIECLHGWKPSISKSMVKNQTEGMVEIDRLEFSVMKEIISHVTDIPIIGKKFYRDQKVSGQAVAEFTKI